MEVTGQPFATLMQHADLVSGLLLGAAFLAAGMTAIQDARPEWAAMMVFALAGALGGAFPEICSDGVNAVCRHREFDFQLPSQQYMHIVAGILEFGGITLALFYAWRRPARMRLAPPGSIGAWPVPRSWDTRSLASPTW